MEDDDDVSSKRRVTDHTPQYVVQGWQFDKKVSIQHLITLGTLIVGGILGFTALSKDVAVNATRISQQEAQLIILKSDFQNIMNELKYEMRELRSDIRVNRLTGEGPGSRKTQPQQQQEPTK